MQFFIFNDKRKTEVHTNQPTCLSKQLFSAWQASACPVAELRVGSSILTLFVPQATLVDKFRWQTL